jgi:hypothetical protein
VPGWADSLSQIAATLGASNQSVSKVAQIVEMANMSLQLRSLIEVQEGDWRLQNPDLEMFLAAEALRDEVQAPMLAASLFEEVSLGFPESPVAPKALLAAAALNPDRSDRLLETVRRLYPSSPYVLVLRGLAHDAYAAIEDSLRSLILARRGAI